MKRELRFTDGDYQLTVILGDVDGFIFQAKGWNVFETDRAMLEEAIRKHIASLQRFLRILEEETDG